MCGKKLLENLESDIEKFDRIVLIWEEGPMAERWLEAFYGSDTVKNGDRKILVLSVLDEIPGKGNFALSFPPMCFPNLSFRHISKTEAKELCKLHYMYDFSNQFLTIPEAKAYGGLFNFVDTGLLQMDEVWEALLH
ncbi:hypothetical protein D3Z55_21810 [Clostridiaceae bacterium]|nr:hypothetical protein [Clostridiaceae bacterium]